MRAVRFARHGDPSVLHVEQVPDPPAPRGDELLVQVHASSVNGTDLGLRRGDLRIATWGRLPFTPGFDLAGRVLACGPRVTAFRPGDRVMALLGHRGGGLAEQVLLRQSRAARIPASLTSVQAAALPLAGLTALQALYGLAELPSRPAARVLVIGGAGGVGAYAIQLARLAGAHVTTTARPAQHEFVTGLGAHEVLDRTDRGLDRAGQNWDVVLDTPGAFHLADLRHILTPDGLLVSTRGVSADAVRAALPARLRPAGPAAAAVRTSARSQDLAHLGALVASERLVVPVAQVHLLAAAAQAHRAAEAGAQGKVVIRLPDA